MNPARSEGSGHDRREPPSRGLTSRPSRDGQPEQPTGRAPRAQSRASPDTGRPEAAERKRAACAEAAHTPYSGGRSGRCRPGRGRVLERGRTKAHDAGVPPRRPADQRRGAAPRVHRARARTRRRAPRPGHGVARRSRVPPAPRPLPERPERAPAERALPRRGRREAPRRGGASGPRPDGHAVRADASSTSSPIRHPIEMPGCLRSISARNR